MVPRFAGGAEQTATLVSENTKLTHVIAEQADECQPQESALATRQTLGMKRA
jgi:hypothetical protein